MAHTDIHQAADGCWCALQRVVFDGVYVGGESSRKMKLSFKN